MQTIKAANCSLKIHAALSRPRPLFAGPVLCHHSSTHQHKQLTRSLVLSAATEGSQRSRTDTSPKQHQQQQQSDRSSSADVAGSSTPVWLQQLQVKWEELDTPQKVYAVVVVTGALAALPKVSTLVVLGIERLIIGGLLAAEEVLLELLLKGGALLGLCAVVGLVLAGVYLFLVPKATK